jgi:tetratricopeptide (TPR) repeat protein
MASCARTDRLVRRVAWLLMALPAACQLPPMAVEGKGPASYEKCQDEQGRAALDQARVLLQAGKDADALPLLRTVVARCPDLVRAHLLYQDAARRVGGAAEEEMRAFYAELPAGTTPVAAYVKARLRDDSPFLQKEALDQILAKDPSFYWAHLSLGRLLRAHGKYMAAAESMRRALALHAGLLEARVELAETLVELGRYQEAAAHYAQYLAAQPNDLVVARSYAQLLVYRLARPDEALTWIERLLQRDPDDASALMDRAAALWRKDRNQAKEALALYLRVLQQKPDNARALLDIGYLYYDVLADNDEALRRRYWPKARTAFELYLRCARSEEMLDYLEEHLAVPCRLKTIADAGIPDDAEPPAISSLQPDAGSP